MKISTLILTTLYALTLSFYASASLETNANPYKAKLFINGEESLEVEPGAPAHLELHIEDRETGKVITQFRKLHAKLMHIMIIKSDLSEFKHVHPSFSSSGIFQLTLNIKHRDPDNFQTENAIINSGKYLLMAEVDIPKAGLKRFHFTINAKGQDQIIPLKIDQQNANGEYVKYFNSLGALDQHGAHYQAKLKYKSTQGCGGNLVNFQLEINEYEEGDGYRPMTDLTKWLQAGAHGAWMSEKKMIRGKMSMGHLHAPFPWLEPHRLTFSFFDKKLINPGKQKIWFQFKQKNKGIMTIPFTFEYSPIFASDENCLQ